MSFTYDPTTTLGQVRLLAVDFDSANATFQDADIQAFLNLNGQNIRLAAAQAVDTIAALAAAVQGRTRFAGIQLDGSVVAERMSALAGELRRQVYAGEDGSDSSPIDWAEWVVDPFSYRDKLVNEMLRQSASSQTGS